MSVMNITSDDFIEEVIEHEDETVFVDFWAPWCAPCKSLSPIFKALSDEVDAKFVKINIEENQDIADEYNIKSIPTIIAFRDGEIIATMIGAKGLESFVDDNI